MEVKRNRKKERLLYLVTAAVMLLPIVMPLPLPTLAPSPGVREFHAAVESLPDSAPVLVSLDIPPAFNPELKPLALAFCRQAFRRKLRVVGVTLNYIAIGSAQEILAEAAALENAVYGRDYVYLGWNPGEAAVVTGMGISIKSVFARDASGTPLDSIPAMSGVSSLRDVALVAQIGAGFQSFPPWIAYATDKLDKKAVIGCNAGAEPTLRPFFSSGQLAGLIASTRGAAEYEGMLGIRGGAGSCLSAISFAQIGLCLLMLAALFL